MSTHPPHGHGNNNLQNSTLLSQGLSPGPHSHHTGHIKVLCALHILMAMWVCLANAFQLLNIVLQRNLRKQPKNILVANVTVIELIIGGFLCPLYSDSLMKGSWTHDVSTCIIYELIFYIQVCVSTLAVLVLVVERFYYLLTPRMMDGAGKRGLTVLLVILPWVIGVAAVLPMFLSGATASFNVDTKSCQILWKRKFQTVIVFVSFFCPAFLVLTMAAAVVMAYVIFSIIAKRRDLGPNPNGQLMRDSLRVVLLSSFTCVTMQFPFFIVLLMEMFCQADIGPHAPCGQSETAWAAVMVVIMLKPGFMPLTWLAYSDVRDGASVGMKKVYHIFRSARDRRARQRGSAESEIPLRPVTQAHQASARAVD